MKQKSFEEALSSLASLCAESEKCKDDITQKAFRWGLSKDDAQKIAERLEEENFINELRFASFYARDKYRFAKWGRKKIEYMLKMKHIPQEYIDKALKEIPQEDYTEILTDLLCSKVKTTKFSSVQELRAKLFRFCASKGYEIDDISKTVNNVIKEIKIKEDED